MRRCLPVLALAIALLPSPPLGGAVFPDQTRREATFRQALGAWTNGDEDGALAQLSRLDQEAVAGSRESSRLESAKLAVARALGRHDAAAVLAVAAFEHRASLAYSGLRPALAAEARRCLASLVELHAKLDRRPAARDIEAAMLASLGGELAGRAQRSAAADLYGRALVLLPKQPAALLGLAALEEQQGHYAEAVDLLTTLVAIAPQGREGRLRLAINRLRLGKDRDAAERSLAELSGQGLDWVRSLAAQELARLLAARGDYAAAANLITSSAIVLPCDPSLPVQAALLAEHAGTASPLDLSTLGACGEAAESARSRYTHPPSSELAPLRAALAAAEPEWQRALAKALGLARPRGSA